MTKPSVIIEGVSKKFGLQLRTALKYGLWDSFRRMSGRGKDQKLREGEFWALQDVTATLEPGDALGIMGVNGSGKTTLLRILNGTYSPDVGKVTLRGRIGALIAAGAGFSPMLSGRENVFINGALLGMTTKEIRVKFDEIVAFAELDKFIDMPVRNYSSGMSVRLGFAIAVLGQPDILLVDEVLAVGDIAFQKKCYERIFTLRDEGVTILLVSHAPGSIWAVCNKGLVLDHGVSSGVIDVESACKLYDHANYRQTSATLAQSQSEAPQKNYGGVSGGTGDVLVENMIIKNSYGTITNEIEFGQPFTIEMCVSSKKCLENIIFRILIDGEINKALSIIDSYELGRNLYKIQEGKYIVRISIQDQFFRPNIYTLNVGIVSKEIGVHLYFKYNCTTLTILHNKNIFLYADYRASFFVNGCFSLEENTCAMSAKAEN